MKIEKWIIFILALIFLVNFTSAANSCNLVPKVSCSVSNSVLYLYSSTNSHAMTTWTSGSSDGMLALCCNFNGEKVCSNTNEVMSISTLSNAHAEIPSLTTYGTRICYGDLSCIGTNNPSYYLTNYPIKMLSLSSQTNAHIGNYNAYSYKILCKRTTSSSSNSLQNSNIVFPNNLNNNLNLNLGQLGTSASTINIKLSNINANANTPIILEIYERDIIPSIGGGTGTNSNAETKSFFGIKIPIINQIVSSLIQFTGKITGHATSTTTTNSFNYIYQEIRTLNLGSALTKNAQNGEVSFEWTVSSSDITRAGTENNYDFIFKAINGNDVKRYDLNPLKVNVNWNVNPPGLNKEKSWLDKDKKTKIKTKSMNWNDLPLNGGSGVNSNLTLISGGTGVKFTGITGGVINLIGNNLIYMNASGIGATPGSTVYFEIWEKDSQEGGSDDAVRIGLKSISATVDSNQNAIASFYVNREDINLASSSDPITNNVGNYEMYFKVRNSSNYYFPIPEGNYSLLNLRIIYSSGYGAVCGNGICEAGENSTNCPQDCPPNSNYLTNARGLWADEEFGSEIYTFNYVLGETNQVGLYVDGIEASAEGKTLNFGVWEKDYGASSNENNSGLEGPTGVLDDLIVPYGNLNSVINGGVAGSIWTINSQNLADAGNESVYQFYFKVGILNENKSFENKLLNVSVVDSISGGGGDYCDDIYYCSDYETESKCNEDPCYDVLDNEFNLNPEADCSNPNVYCYCYWTSGDECKFSYDKKSSNDLGNCNFIQLGVQDDCENSGLLITSYEATWNWSSENCYNNSNDCTNAIINAIEESCLQKDGCWRKVDYSYDNCTNYEESTACSTTGGLGGEGIFDDPIAIIKDKNNWWIFLIIGIVIIGLIIFFVVRRLKKGDIETRLFKTKENFNNILSYIKNARVQKMPDSEIRKSLSRVGWTEQQINYAFKKASK